RERSVYACSVVVAAASIIAVEGAASGREKRKIDKVIRLSRGFPVWALHQHFT
ncbi:hypothetical protein WUBG_03122, partial [Wuchereria bancrofti]